MTPEQIALAVQEAWIESRALTLASAARSLEQIARALDAGNTLVASARAWALADAYAHEARTERGRLMVVRGHGVQLDPNPEIDRLREERGEPEVEHEPE